MKQLILTILFSTFFFVFSFSQTREQLVLYQSAFDEMMTMIKDEKPVDFKRAVFLTENAHYDNTLDYGKFCAEIDNHVEKIRNIIKSQPADAQKFKTIGQWAIFVYMTAELPENDHKSFLYNFDNFLPTQNPTNGFVTKLLQTKKGNCVSLPYLFKIFANEIDVEAHLAFAPMHCYIKHKDEDGKWRNIELTNGSLARDVWIMQTMGVTAEQITSGLYMRAISEKECIASSISDLLYSYNRKYFLDFLTLPMIDCALIYFPNDFRLLRHKSNSYGIFTFVEKSQRNPDNGLIESYTLILDEIDKKISKLGYIQGDVKEYERWAKSEGRKLNEEYQEKRRKAQAQERLNE
jgi:hypothetical protein